MTLSCQQISLAFGTEVILDKISFHIEEHEKTAIVGINGAGKSTTIDCMIGLKRFNSGTIELLSYDIKEEPLLAKSHFGYVPSEPNVCEAMTGYEYLEFVASIYQISEGQFKTNYKYLCSRLQLKEEDLEVPTANYSHGMKQKLALVSALIHSPRLLLLDEPFVGLDPISSHEMKLIMQEMAKAGATIFYSTHVLDVAEKICDQVAIIKQGKLVVFGKMEEVKGMQSLENVFLELENDKHD